MKYAGRRWLRVGIVLVAAVLVQVSVVADLPIAGAQGDLMLVLALAAGSVAGPNVGVTYGFAAGVTYDLLLDTPFGLSALSCAVAAYLVGVVSILADEDTGAWFHLVTAAIAGIVSVVVGVLVTLTLGFAYAWSDVIAMALVVALWAALLIMPFRRLMTWAIGSDEADDLWVALP